MGPSVQTFIVKNELDDGTVIWSVVMIINTTRPEDKELTVHIAADNQVHARHIKYVIDGDF